jgi:hypothetical protein
MQKQLSIRQWFLRIFKHALHDNGYAAAIAESGTRRIFPSSNGSFVVNYPPLINLTV